jgi:thioredoxin reductase (NADPH)
MDDTSARPAILTVDDDPDVSRAVARDLRRHYGERYRIVRAESADDALDALRQLRLRGEQVAVILADYRMPQMNGIEFLERAMDIYPGARRALLTAYADTGAAIEAINVVDLDYYLLKPWDPPEEKLYPVVDALLESWHSEEHRHIPEPKVIGHRWSARSSEVREFLARNQVPYRFFSTDEPTGQQLLAAAGADGERLPVILSWPPTSGWPRPRRLSSTTSSSSGQGRPASALRSTVRRKDCGPCCWSGPRPAARRARAPGSRTTSAFLTACRARS